MQSPVDIVHSVDKCDIRRCVCGNLLVASVALVTACGTPTTSPSVSPRSTPSPRHALNEPAASPTLLAAWRSYITVFIKQGRVIDPRSNSNTTSEGQSYALLRAAWMNDRATFDDVWSWTQSHLWDDSTQRFGWLWSGAESRSLSHDSATDADQDIALALIFASRRWADGAYVDWAHRVLRGLWENGVASLNGTPYVVAGNWAAHSTGTSLVLNPSYFAPYAYRIFASFDTSRPWMSLVGSSYAALNACTQAPLAAVKSAGLPPNWCVLDVNGRVSSFTDKSDGDDYGYDAFRVMWRVALDAAWNNASSATSYLSSQLFLQQQWQTHHSLIAVYGHDGSPKASYEDPAVYGGDAGAFLGRSNEMSAAILQKLTTSFNQTASTAYWGQQDNYYAQNWAWFGTALLSGDLPNLAG